MALATTVPLPSSPVQVASAETDGIWVVESVGDKIWAATINNFVGGGDQPIKVLKIDKATGLIENTYQAAAGAEGSVNKSSVDNSYLWLNNFNSLGITRVKLSDGTSNFFAMGSTGNDDIDSDGEFVWDADTVAQLGNGSSDAGAKFLDKFREAVRAHKRSAPNDKIPPKASPLQYVKEAMKNTQKA